MTTSAVSRQRLVDRPGPPSPPAPRAADECPPLAARIAGRYRYEPGTGGWWWSAEMFVLHGLPPGSPQPDTETYLRHQHADDRARVVEAISRACATGLDFALETRIIRADGEERDVVLMGECRAEDGAGISAVEGLAVDITDCHRPGSSADRAQALEAEVGQLRTAMASRASIEQAKGILMLLTGCSDPVAFELLTHISSHTHRKVRDVALAITESAVGRTRLPDDVRAIVRDACPPAHPFP